MNRKTLFRTILLVFKTSPWDCVIMFGVQIILAFIPTAILLTNRMLIENLNQSRPLWSSIVILAFYCIGLFTQRFLYNWYNHYYLTYYSLLRFEKRIKLSLFDICDKLQLSDYLNSDVVNSTMRAKNASINLFRVTQAVGEMGSCLLGSLGLGVILGSIDVNMAIIIILLALSSIFENIYIIIQNKKLIYSNTQLEKEEDAISNLLLKPSSLKEIKSFSCESFILHKWQLIYDELKRSKHKSNTKIFLVSFSIAFLSFASQIIAYAILFYQFSESRLYLAEFSVAITAFSSINGLLKNMFEIIGGIGQFLVMVKPYFDYEDMVQSKIFEPVLHSENQNKIVLKNVSYKYPQSDQYALENLNLEISLGERIAIVGANGSGKTTLLRLIIGLFTPSVGTIDYGKAVFPSGSICEKVSLVPQQINTYSLSIKDNIVFGKLISSAYLSDQLHQIGLDSLIENVDTVLGREFGDIDLSGGQKQRLAILRAQNKISTIIAFDEPTSAIDPLQEHEIFKHLLSLMSTKTVFVISHRLALARDCDKIVVLDQGHIVEVGTHEQLLESPSIYSKLWHTQASLYS